MTTTSKTTRRRALPAVGLTAAGLIMLSRFHSTPAVSGTRLRSATPSSPLPRSFGTIPGAGAGGSRQTGTTGSPSSAIHDGTFTGSEVQTRWGPVQVQIAVKGGMITDVQAVEMPDSHGRSIEINDQAAPLLRDEALTAQKADIDLLSGATITWDGYRQSLQAALDAAHR